MIIVILTALMNICIIHNQFKKSEKAYNDLRKWYWDDGRPADGYAGAVRNRDDIAGYGMEVV